MSTFIIGTAAVVGAVSGTMKIFEAIGANKRRRQAMKDNEKAKAKMERQRDEYMNMPVTNPYLDKENVYEDLTVNTQAAEFAAEQNQQGLANTLANMNQAAGGSGIAALAQALAGQSAIANQKASISIAEQERQNEMKERAQADQLDTLERKGNKYVEDMRRNMAREALGYTMADIAGNNAEIREAGEQTRQAIEDAGTSFASTTEALGNL
tara:strand:- start:1175 stop:1807 length:633 start_codon:yes stop_codon:yes gene_type:complete